jgi:imidazole glycerol-phosphate synthase subunit HisH
MNRVGIIDYKCGNVRSLFNSLDFIGANPFLISHAQDFKRATHIILPGVGAFEYCMDNLRHSNLIEPLSVNIFEKSKPLLGICVGMQMLLSRSAENGNHDGLGWVDGSVEKLRVNAADCEIKIPHVGWNSVRFKDENEFFKNDSDYDFYFDHSYAAQNVNSNDIAGKTEYGIPFPSVIKKNNILASQFHPEKSQTHGIQFLKLFLG